MTARPKTPDGTGAAAAGGTAAGAATVVAPTLDDPVAAAGAEALGGPAGRRMRLPAGFWTPVRVLLVVAAAVYLLGAFLKYPCQANGWADPDRYEHLCYSDMPPLYSLRGFAAGLFPYLQTAPGSEVLEYPVLTGLFMAVAGGITRLISPTGSGETFYLVNVAMLSACLFAAVAATALTVRRRPWDALLLVLAPGVWLASYINWDLLAVALTSAAIAAWARRREGWAGVMLGLAISAKFYPLVLLGPWALLCLRAGRVRELGRLLAGTAVAWLVVNLPFMLASFDGWSWFYRFSAERGQDFGSFWLALDPLGWSPSPASLNRWATGAFLVACIAIAGLLLAAPRRPRLAQGLFLVVAAFVLTNKVYSPQYVLWLLPLAVLARPRWRELLVWQAAEVVYFVAIWWYLVTYTEGAKGLTVQWYSVAIGVHLVATAWFAGVVVRDVLHPERDPVRSDGVPGHADDPGGGCLDAAPDRWTLTGAEPVGGVPAGGGGGPAPGRGGPRSAGRGSRRYTASEKVDD